MSTGTEATDGVAPVRIDEKEDPFDLRILVRELWRWKWVVLLITFAGVAVGVNDARKYVPRYRAEMIVAPAASGGAGMAPRSGVAIMGAVQSLGLIGGSGVEITPFEHFKLIIGSQKLAQVLQERHGLLQTIFKGN